MGAFIQFQPKNIEVDLLPKSKRQEQVPPFADLKIVILKLL